MIRCLLRGHAVLASVARANIAVDKRASDMALIQTMPCNLKMMLIQRQPKTWLHATSAACSEVVQFHLSDIGEGIKEVTVKEWFVQPGDHVAQFDQICEVQSDKASVTITSRFDGVVKKLYFNVDQIAQTGDALVDIEVEGGGGSGSGKGGATAEKLGRDQQVAASDVADADAIQIGEGGRSQEEGGRGQTLATPAVRHLAIKHGLNLGSVPGSGKDGRVLKEDVLRFLDGRDEVKGPLPTQELAKTLSKPVVTKIQPKRAAPPIAVIPAGKDHEVPFTAFTRAMFKKMTQALMIPHFGYNDEIDMSELGRLRRRLKDEEDLRISYLPFIVKAASLALAQFPQVNASIDLQREVIVQHGNHNIGIAMDTEFGLIVPNIKGVQHLSVTQIAEELMRLNELAKRSKLGEKDLKGGTFTISNIGSVGGTYASPVIMPPEVAIGALGKIQRLPRFDQKGQVVPIDLMKVSWCADHRVLDGATVARFSNEWKRYLESPTLMLLALK